MQKQAYKPPAKIDRGSGSTSCSSQFRFLSTGELPMAELPMAEPVGPIPIACPFRPWKRQQWSVLRMDFLLPVFNGSVFALGLSYCSLSSLSQSECCQLIFGQGVLADTLRQMYLGLKWKAEKSLNPSPSFSVSSNSTGQPTNMLYIMLPSTIKAMILHPRLISHSSVHDI